MPATLTLHPLFTDHAVLPREVPLPISGRTVPGQTVKVSFAGQQISARADSKGAWVAVFQPILAGGPHTLSVSMTGGQLIRRDLYTGDVWLVAGQVNAAMPLSESSEARAVIAQANLPRIRFFVVPPSAAAVPDPDGDGRWEKCTPEKAAAFSALGFHFARTMHEAVESPIGIIQATVAESSGLAWVPVETLRARTELAGKIPAAGAKNAATAATPGAVFGGMIAPFTHFPIKGVVAYQGETDIERAHLYRSIFAAQIQGWRAAWKRPELPFLFVQLAGYLASKADPVDDLWAELREAQALAARLPATAMAVAADLGDRDSMQPRNKRAVAERLALGALAVAHRRSMPFSGPVYAEHVVKDGAMHLKFSHAESGLRAHKDGPMLGFAVAGADRVFRWSDARIESDRLIVSHPAIPTPVAARYAWEMHPHLSLENGAGLPAVPFRTDNWAGLSAGRT